MDPRLREEVRFLTTRLGVILREKGGDELFARVERLRLRAKAIRSGRPELLPEMAADAASLTIDAARDVAHAFSLFFQLVNLAEERQRLTKLAESPVPPRGLGALFEELRARGVDADRLQRCIDALEIEPVLTAHPTEPKRRTTLFHLLRIAGSPKTPDEALETLWFTEEVRRSRMTPLDEVRTTMFFFEHAIQAAGRYARECEALIAELTHSVTAGECPGVRAPSAKGSGAGGPPMERAASAKREQARKNPSALHRERNRLRDEEYRVVRAIRGVACGPHVRS